MIRVAMMCFGVIFLLSCGGESHKKSEPVTPYVPPSPGLLENAQFAFSEDGRLAGWRLSQHAGAPSYRLASVDGVVSMSRVDKEPWGALVQLLRVPALTPLLGSELEFSAEISGDFTDEYGVPIQPTGMSVLLKGVAAGANPMFGRQILFNEVVPLVSTAGHVSWQRYAIRFDVPSRVEASSVEVELGFYMANGGVMKIRGPALVVVE